MWQALVACGAEPKAPANEHTCDDNVEVPCDSVDQNCDGSDDCPDAEPPDTETTYVTPECPFCPGCDAGLGTVDPTRDAAVITVDTPEGLGHLAPGNLDGDNLADALFTIGVVGAERLKWFAGPLAPGAMSDSLASWVPSVLARGLGDMDNDGDDDIVVSRYGAFGIDHIEVFAMPLYGTITTDDAVAWTASGLDVDGITLSDLDGDLEDDLVFLAPTDDGLAIEAVSGPFAGPIDLDLSFGGVASDEPLDVRTDGDGFADLDLDGLGDMLLWVNEIGSEPGTVWFAAGPIVGLSDVQDAAWPLVGEASTWANYDTEGDIGGDGGIDVLLMQKAPGDLDYSVQVYASPMHPDGAAVGRILRIASGGYGLIDFPDAVEFAGDLDADGFGDMIVDLRSSAFGEGQAEIRYGIVFGPLNGIVLTHDLNMLCFSGWTAGADVFEAEGAGDLDGDALDDLYVLDTNATGWDVGTGILLQVLAADLGL